MFTQAHLLISSPSTHLWSVLRHRSPPRRSKFIAAFVDAHAGRGKVDCLFFFFFSSRRRHTRYWRDWSSDVCSSDLTSADIGDIEGHAAALAGRLCSKGGALAGGHAEIGRGEPLARHLKAPVEPAERDRKSVV